MLIPVVIPPPMCYAVLRNKLHCLLNSENYETARVCLENEYDGGCDICGFIRFMFGNVKDDLCNKKYCFNHNGLYATVAGGWLTKSSFIYHFWQLPSHFICALLFF